MARRRRRRGGAALRGGGFASGLELALFLVFAGVIVWMALRSAGLLA